MYTERAPKRQQFHVASAMQQLNTAVPTLVDIQNVLCKSCSHSELRSCVKVEVDVLSSSAPVQPNKPTVSVDVKQHFNNQYSHSFRVAYD